MISTLLQQMPSFSDDDLSIVEEVAKALKKTRFLERNKSYVLPEKARAALVNDGKIAAIKALRQEEDIGIREASWLVDSYLAQ